MVTLQGKQVFLRALEPEDLEFVYDLENDENLWEISSTQTPYSKFLIKQYLENAHQDIYESKQLRLVICKNDNNEVLGFIDLYDFNPTHKRAGVGVVILSAQERGQGYGSQALDLLINYGKTHLHLHQLYAGVSEDNLLSQRLFESKGFRLVGQKKDWTFVAGQYKNENLYQLIYVH